MTFTDANSFKQPASTLGQVHAASAISYSISDRSLTPSSWTQPFFLACLGVQFWIYPCGILALGFLRCLTRHFDSLKFGLPNFSAFRFTQISAAGLLCVWDTLQLQVWSIDPFNCLAGTRYPHCYNRSDIFFAGWIQPPLIRWISNIHRLDNRGRD